MYAQKAIEKGIQLLFVRHDDLLFACKFFKNQHTLPVSQR